MCIGDVKRVEHPVTFEWKLRNVDMLTRSRRAKRLLR